MVELARSTPLRVEAFAVGARAEVSSEATPVGLCPGEGELCRIAGGGDHGRNLHPCWLPMSSSPITMHHEVLQQPT